MTKLEQRACELAEEVMQYAWAKQGEVDTDKLVKDIVRLARDFAKKALSEARHQASMSYMARLNKTDIAAAIEAAEGEDE